MFLYYIDIMLALEEERSCNSSVDVNHNRASSIIYGFMNAVTCKFSTLYLHTRRATYVCVRERES